MPDLDIPLDVIGWSRPRLNAVGSNRPCFPDEAASVAVAIWSTRKAPFPLVQGSPRLGRMLASVLRGRSSGVHSDGCFSRLSLVSKEEQPSSAADRKNALFLLVPEVTASSTKVTGFSH